MYTRIAVIYRLIYILRVFRNRGNASVDAVDRPAVISQPKRRNLDPQQCHPRGVCASERGRKTDFFDGSGGVSYGTSGRARGGVRYDAEVY